MLEYVFLKSLSNVETYQDYSNKAVVEYYFPLLIPVFLKKYVFNYFLKKKSISKSIWGQKFKLKYHLDRNNIESFKLFILFHFVIPFLGISSIFSSSFFFNTRILSNYPSLAGKISRETTPAPIPSSPVWYSAIVPNSNTFRCASTSLFFRGEKNLIPPCVSILDLDDYISFFFF